jgi:hypothetical protein
MIIKRKYFFLISLFVLGTSYPSEGKLLHKNFVMKDSLQYDDSIKFSKAYEFIKSYQDLNKEFNINYWDSLYTFNISISNEVIDIKPIFFINEILCYEYDSLTLEEQVIIKDSIRNSNNGPLKILTMESDFFISHAPSHNTDLLVFFSVPEGNKLLVQVFPYKGYNDYKNSSFLGKHYLSILFYFNNNVIIKYFVKKF